MRLHIKGFAGFTPGSNIYLRSWSGFQSIAIRAGDVVGRQPGSSA
jgi:hypothetical protein